MDTPLVSIIVPTYNREKYIAQAISSAQKQSYRNWEMIVVDDASIDKTDDIVAEMAKEDRRIRYVVNPKNMGIARTRNRGLEEAKGSLVAMLDSDDMWSDPEKLTKQVAFLKANPDHVLVGTYVTVINNEGIATGSVRYESNDSDIRKKIFLRNQFAQSSLLYKKAVVQNLGGYDATYTVNDDYDLWLKIGLAHTFANIPEYTTSYRQHSGSITIEKRLMAADEHILIIRKYKDSYPNYSGALLKGYARVVLALLGL